MQPKTQTPQSTPVTMNGQPLRLKEALEKYHRTTKSVGIPKDLYEEIRILGAKVGMEAAPIVIAACRLVVKRLKAGASLALTQDGATLVEVAKPAA